jgi:hypothetical protein
MDTEVRKLRGYWWHRRECWVPTWRGWLLLVILGAAALVVGLFSAYPFLALTRPVTSDVLVAEGWGEDSMLKGALAEFKRGNYSRLLVTGGPIEQGNLLMPYRTYAELGAATLQKMGVPTNALQAVPAPVVQRDRTYTSAMALRRHLHATGSPSARLNVVTTATHARRTCLLFQKALGPETEVGILPIPDPTYDSRRWWTSSQGFRDVIAETIAYVYARLFFHPPVPSTVG